MTPKKFLLLNLTIFVLVILLLFIGYFLFFVYQDSFGFKLAQAEEDEEADEDPPNISGIKISEVTATSTTITWETDEEADSLVNYALNKNYGIVRDALLKKTHKIVVDNLLSPQLYYFRIISSDAEGNQSISNDYSFTTEKRTEEEIKKEEEVEPAPEGELAEKSEGEGKGEGKGEGDGEGQGAGDGENDAIIKKMLGLLEKISDEKSLSLIESKIQNIAEEAATPPTIRGNYAKVEVGADYAIITWDTDKEANSIVALAREDDYDPEAAKPYVWKEGEPDEMVLEHMVEVAGLRPATTYHYQVSSRSKLGLQSKSEDSVFRTKSILPEIYNISITKVEEESATITWTTNVPSSAIIEYTDLNTNETKLEGNSTLVTVHSIRLTNLKFDTYYSIVIKVENEHKEETVSDPLTFTTTRDKFPPAISTVNTESTIYPGSSNRIQTIVSWETDEPSICQFFFQKGLAMDNEEGDSLPKEEDFITKHVQVVTAFQPATVYKFWIQCQDKAGNAVKSDDFTMLTPAQEESIIDLIIGNFEGTFGWLKKLKM